MTEPRHKLVDSLGLTIHYLEWGEPVGEPLVLVHGFLDQAHSWKFFVEELEKKARQPLWIVAPDCRGHGDSGWVGVGGYYHFPDYVFDLDCVIRSLGVERFNLIGHSMGGTIAFLYAGAFPTRVGKLVLIEGVGPPGLAFADSPPRLTSWIGELHERGRRHFREYTSIEAGARQLLQTNARLKKEYALDLARAGMKQSLNGKWIWKFDPLHRTAAPQPFYAAQALEFFRRIECPVLIVDGEESRQTRRSDKQQRYEAIRQRQLETIAHAGHMVHQDNPEHLAAIIDSFLRL